MLNFERYETDIADICETGDDIAIVNGVPVGCNTLSNCTECDFDSIDEYHYQLLKWATAEYKEPAPKLTKREREFLECFSIMGTKKISRNHRGLFVSHFFEKNNARSFEIDGKMFPFVKPGESWSFEELMKLEVEE